MRDRRRHFNASRLRAGFTLIEVMFATLLMSVVGMAIVGFMSAFASGIQTRTTISDPALEASLAARRLASVAPGFCFVLQVNGARAAIWLSDSVPSRMVDLSEIGLVRFDETNGMLVLETMDPMEMAVNPLLERELAYSSSTDFIGAIEDQRDAGRTVRSILAEGLEAAQFSTQGVPSGHATITITLEAGSARIALSPAFLEEPVQ
jgi:hypothetical protein